MRLIDADTIDFSAIKDPFDKTRAEIIIQAQPTIKPENGIVIFSNRLIISKKFEEWCNDLEAKKVPESMVAFLRLNNLLYVEKCNEYAEQNKDILNNGG